MKKVEEKHLLVLLLAFLGVPPGSSTCNTYDRNTELRSCMYIFTREVVNVGACHCSFGKNQWHRYYSLTTGSWCISSASSVVTAVSNAPAVGGRKWAKVSSCEEEEKDIKRRAANFESVDIEVSIYSMQ